MEKYKEFKLPKEFGETLIAALRSGEYKQNTGSLVLIKPDKNCYCVMGVVGKIAEIEDDDMEYFAYLSSITKSKICGLPIEFLPDCSGNTLTDRLVEMNDKQRRPFPEIADWIENNIQLY